MGLNVRNRRYFRAAKVLYSLQPPKRYSARNQEPARNNSSVTRNATVLVNEMNGSVGKIMFIFFVLFAPLVFQKCCLTRDCFVVNFYSPPN